MAPNIACGSLRLRREKSAPTAKGHPTCRSTPSPTGIKSRGVESGTKRVLISPRADNEYEFTEDQDSTKSKRCRHSSLEGSTGSAPMGVYSNTENGNTETERVSRLVLHTPSDTGSSARPVCTTLANQSRDLQAPDLTAINISPTHSDYVGRSSQDSPASNRYQQRAKGVNQSLMERRRSRVTAATVTLNYDTDHVVSPVRATPLENNRHKAELADASVVVYSNDFCNDGYDWVISLV